MDGSSMWATDGQKKGASAMDSPKKVGDGSTEEGHGRWLNRKETWATDRQKKDMNDEGTCAMAGQMKHRSNGWTPVVYSGNGSDK